MHIKAVMRTDDHHIAKHNKILGMKNEDDIQLVFLGDSLTRRCEDNIDLWNKYFSAYKAANFGVGIVILGLLPRNVNETGIDYVQKIGRINRQLDTLYANTEITYIDIGIDLINDQVVVSDTTMPDGLHLNGN